MTAAVTPLREGDPSRLGAYRLTGLLGEGGQGSVYLGEDEPGRRVAVKLLHARFSGDPRARARFAAEVATAKRVSAFCTARILDSDVEGDRPYIVSEYIEGPPLSEVLASGGPLRGAELDRLAIGTMTALAAIHQAGVVHRDFKPANVLLAPDGPRVIDFGIARALDATGTMSSTAVGTPAYMAPEQISGARVGPAADVFAWGATMVYAACGRPAFGQDSIPAVMHRILNLPPDLGDLGEPLREIVANCLSKDPALRPASPHVLAHLLSLAGSLPQPEAGRDEADGGGGEDAAILTQAARLAEPAFMPAPERAGEAGNEDYNSRPIGNGPFTVEQYEADRSVTLVRNDSWAFGKTRLDRVGVDFDLDPAMRRAAYSIGEVDWKTLTGDEAATAPQDDDLVTRPGPFTRMLVPVLARGPMKSKEAREAVSLAIDREKLGKLFGGVRTPARGIVPASVPGFGERGRCASCDGPDPDKARSLARRAGLEPGTEVKLHFMDLPAERKIAESVRNELQTTLSLKIEIVPTPLDGLHRPPDRRHRGPEVARRSSGSRPRPPLRRAGNGR